MNATRGSSAPVRLPVLAPILTVFLGVGLPWLGGCMAGPGAPAPADRSEIDHLLDGFHAAAVVGDGERYFGSFTPDGIFVGTDATEYWTVDEFRVYAEPHFADGAGWDYAPTSRQVVIGGAKGSRSDAAWFHELLHNAKYGACRGTGTLVRVDGEWKIAQYALTFPVPNDVALEVIAITQREPAATE